MVREDMEIVGVTEEDTEDKNKWKKFVKNPFLLNSLPHFHYSYIIFFLMHNGDTVHSNILMHRGLNF